VISVLFGGLGLVVYTALWLGIVRRDESESIASRIVSRKRETQLLLVCGTCVIALLIAADAVGLAQGSTGLSWVLGRFSWALGLSCVGLLGVWRGASLDEKSHLQELLNSAPIIGTEKLTGWKQTVARSAVGVVLVVIGFATVSKGGVGRYGAVHTLLGALVLLFGFFVLFAPWWLRTVRELTSERRDRVRAEERADMAAHLHDSVLQTLSLIQRASDNPTEVARLARIQERDLRSWLFDPLTFARRSGAPERLTEQIDQIVRDVEECYGVPVESVMVGDAELDDAVSALAAAGKEAMVNAAKWSGASVISSYVEVEGDRISMFVRDRGCGFNPGSVPADRHGISHSIVERMERFGGTASIRSTPDSGTEVTLTLPWQPRTA
jgi:signal transduction histidine kinase